MKLPALLIFLTPFVLNAQDIYSLEDHAAYFMGSWEADQESCVGIGSGTRTYKMVIGDAYLWVNNHAEFPVKDSSKPVDTHDDWGFYSFDKSRGTIVHREFNSEKFILQYRLDSISTDGKKLIFLSDAMENVPSDWEGRVTLTKINENRFEDHFELKMPGKEFTTYVKAVWVRK